MLTAASGAEALRLARDSEQIDLLLTDLEMPGMDGRELAARFAAFHPAAPVLVITTLTHELERAVAFPVLPEPFTIDELRGAVRRALRAHPVAAEFFSTP